MLHENTERADDAFSSSQTRDLLIPKHEAERALTQNEGNLTEALKSLLTPASP